MSLTDGLSKMSKSDANDNSRINLMDSPDVIKRKIKRCKTDEIRGLNIIPSDENFLQPGGGIYRPEAVNLLIIYSALTGKSVEEVRVEFLNSSWSEFKPKLVDVLVAYLSPLQKNYTDLMNNKDHIEHVLKNGSEYANEKANKSLREIKHIMGFYSGI